MNKQIKGTCCKVGDGVTSLQIIALPRWHEARLGDWVLEKALPNAENNPGVFRSLGRNVIVAGENFGCGGKSNDFAVLALQDADVSLVIAESFNRIFYRLAIDLGLPVLICPGITAFCDDGEEILCDLEGAAVKKLSDGSVLQATPISKLAFEILKLGGLTEYYKTMCDREDQLFQC